MKKSCIRLAALAAISFVPSVFAVTYVENIAGPADADLHNNDGWTTVTGGGASDPAWVSDWGVDGFGGAIGGIYAVAPSNNYRASQALTGSLSNIQFSTTMQIVDSATDSVDSNITAIEERSNFAFRFLNGSGQNLFSINFTSAIDVDDPSSQTDAAWGMSFSSNSAATFATGDGVAEDGIYTLSFGSSNSGGNAFFDVYLQGEIGPAYHYTYTVPGQASAQIATLAVEWYDDSGAPQGTNYMNFNDMSAVPEPSAAALLALGAAIGLRRRRQA